MDRAILYLRQSVAREDSISLELQETACRRHCEQRGYTVTAVEADPGISGRTFNRPAVKRVMEAVESRQADVVVLWRWSRLSRSRKDWAVAADRVDVAGGRIESATEDLDITTSHGRLARGMLVEFAAFESERIGDQWKETHSRRVRNGLPANGKPRFGYRRAGPGYEPDPTTAPALTEAYRRYIAGESMYSLVKWLNDNGHRTSPGYGHSGGDWSQRTLRRTMDSGFAAGLINSHGEYLPGTHQALITEDEWAAYRAARARRTVTRNTTRSTYLLSGMVRCSCGAAMTAGQFGTQRQAKFRCTAAAQKRTHTGGYVVASTLEMAVLEWMKSLSTEVESAASEVLRMDAARSHAKSSLPALAERVTAAEKAITRLTVSWAEGALSEQAYQSAMAELERRREQAKSAYDEASERARTIPVSIDVVTDLLEVWPILPTDQRREALRGLIDHVRVFPGRPRARIEVVPLW